MALGASVALAAGAHAVTCSDVGGQVVGGQCVKVEQGQSFSQPIAGPSGRINPNNPWTQVFTPVTTSTWQPAGASDQIQNPSHPVVTEDVIGGTVSNPGGHEMPGGVPGPDGTS
jgi:hypothetical protein